MSASLVVDLRNTVQVELSLLNTDDTLLSGSNGVASGVVVGRNVDLKDADTLCNIFFTHGNNTSGQVFFAVQESDTTTSGDFAAIGPNSGESIWLSGGRTTINSSGLALGQGGGTLSGVGRVSGQTLYGHFQRTRRYARIIQESGGVGWGAPVYGGFISQKMITGSGFGVSTAPGSGAISV